MMQENMYFETDCSVNWRKEIKDVREEDSKIVGADGEDIRNNNEKVDWTMWRSGTEYKEHRSNLKL